MKRLAPLIALLGVLGPGAATASAALPDGRGWEMVSPVDKNGGGVADPAEAGIGTFQAAAQGGGVAFASRASFAGGAGAAPFSNYLSFRSSAGWSTQNVTPAHLSGAYEGAPYLAFAADLSRALLANPALCSGGGSCPEGFTLRDPVTGAVLASLTDTGSFEGASENLDHIVLKRGNDLHLWSPPAAPLRINTVAAASLAAANGAVSTDAHRIYWMGQDGNLYLREGLGTLQLDAGLGGGAAFEGASTDGVVAFLSKDGHLYRYLGGGGTDLTPGGDLLAVLGASEDGRRVFYATAAGIHGWRVGAGSELIVADPDLADVHPETSGAIADGSRLHFTTAAALVPEDVNVDFSSGGGVPDVYQWQEQGRGSCAGAGGCVDLISSGRSQARATSTGFLDAGSVFLGASADGADVYFLTDVSLVGSDPGAIDLYDARVGGGFPEPEPPFPCDGDSCQIVPTPPQDPTLTTVLSGPGNSAVRYLRYGSRAKRCPKGKKRRGGKCVKQRKGTKKRGVGR